MTPNAPSLDLSNRSEDKLGVPPPCLPPLRLRLMEGRVETRKQTFFYHIGGRRRRAGKKRKPANVEMRKESDLDPLNAQRSGRGIEISVPDEARRAGDPSPFLGKHPRGSGRSSPWWRRRRRSRFGSKPDATSSTMPASKVAFKKKNGVAQSFPTQTDGYNNYCRGK